MIVHIDQATEPFDDYAAERTRGLYNVGVEDGQRFVLDVDVPIERDDWQIGVIVGPSGSGKTSIARAIHSQGWHEWTTEGAWDPAMPIISELTDAGTYEKACATLSAVGLASVPSWLRPRRILSNGEGFRADMAMLLQMSADKPSEWSVYIDEFTSVLDRQVAKVGAAAFAKAWRKVRDRQIVLVTPHYDVLEWIEPDWWIDTAEGLDEFAEDRGVVQARKGSFQEARHHGGYPGDRVATLEC